MMRLNNVFDLFIADVQVHPQRAFSDSLRQATSMSLLDMTAGGVVVYPDFPAGADARAGLPHGNDESSCTKGGGCAWGARCHGSCADAACAARKAFFQQAGRQMLQHAETGDSARACLPALQHRAAPASAH